MLTAAYAHTYQGDASAPWAADDAGMKAAADVSDFHVGNGYIRLIIAALAAGDPALASDPGGAGWPPLISVVGRT